MKENLLRANKRIISFLKRISFTSVIAGATIGIPIWVLLQYLIIKIPPSSVSAWELIFGVILGGVVGWIIPEFINLLRNKWNVTYPLHAILGPVCVNDLSTVICLGSLFPKDVKGFIKTIPMMTDKTIDVIPKTGMPWVVVENDARALGYIMAVLARGGKAENISVMRDDLTVDITDANIICIGSIKNNHKTLQINTSFKNLPLKFEWKNEDLLIHTLHDDRIWMLEEEYDYGILAKIPNEYDETKVVFIFAGISSYGTVAAAYYLHRNWRKIHAKSQKENFAIILKTRRDNFQYAHIDYEVFF